MTFEIFFCALCVNGLEYTASGQNERGFNCGIQEEVG